MTDTRTHAPPRPADRARAFQTRVQLLAAAGGLVAPLIALVAFFGSGVFPPDAAYRTADEVARAWADDRGIRMAGLLLGFMAIGLLGPLVAVISIQLRRIEAAPYFGSSLQRIAGTVTWMFLSVPLLILFVAAYRTGRAPEITQALHDLGWILFLIPVAPFLVQNVIIALVILSDGTERPVYPRWVAYANLFIGASFLPDLLLGYFTTGPLAYQGLFSFWVPTVTYGLWLNIMGLTSWQAVKRQQREAGEVTA
jgi:hypothetical protein